MIRLDIATPVSHARQFLKAVEKKSWYHAVNAAHACLCSMPSPSWAEEAPGLAKYYMGENEANLR